MLFKTYPQLQFANIPASIASEGQAITEQVKRGQLMQKSL